MGRKYLQNLVRVAYLRMKTVVESNQVKLLGRLIGDKHIVAVDGVRHSDCMHHDDDDVVTWQDGEWKGKNVYDLAPNAKLRLYISWHKLGGT
jgi:hypothetical protein